MTMMGLYGLAKGYFDRIKPHLSRGGIMQSLGHGEKRRKIMVGGE